MSESPRPNQSRCSCANVAKASQLPGFTTHYSSLRLHSNWIKCLVLQDLEGSGEARTNSTGMKWKSINTEKIISVSPKKLAAMPVIGRHIANSCLLTCNHQSKTESQLITRRGFSTPHTSFSLPFVVASLITQCLGWCSRSVFVPFSTLQTARPGFIAPSLCWTDT